MADYTNMAGYYDTIMKSGYYDYDLIANNIMRFQSGENILEIGCGTGLILEKLLEKINGKNLTGIDCTKAMIDIADRRLRGFNNLSLSEQNIVSLTLEEKYDTAFSYGGVWYFVFGDGEPFLVSHIYAHSDNCKGFSQISKHINFGGKLLLGIQNPHYDYDKAISNGMIYSQKITSTKNGFLKEYALTDQDNTVMSQSINYRVYPFDEALAILAKYGFKYIDSPEAEDNLFIEFQKA